MTSHTPPQRNGENLPEGYLEIYKLAVEMADRVSGRRLTTGALPVSGALAALAAVQGVDRILLASVGILLAVSWWTLLRTYVTLAQAKFQFIATLEDRLPVTLYQEEWRRIRDLKNPSPWSRLIEYRLVEQILPAAFGVFFTVVLIEAIAAS